MLYPPELRGLSNEISDLAHSALPVHPETYLVYAGLPSFT